MKLKNLFWIAILLLVLAIPVSIFWEYAHIILGGLLLFYEFVHFLMWWNKNQFGVCDPEPLAKYPRSSLIYSVVRLIIFTIRSINSFLDRLDGVDMEDIPIVEDVPPKTPEEVLIYLEVYDQFMNNLSRTKRRVDIFFKITKENPRFVIGAFDWGGTKEGHEFWKEIHLKASKIMKDEI